jgi:hypothetical protein
MFSARTTQSGKLKALFDVLFSNTQDVMLTISKSGIESELTTINNVNICVSLPADKFEAYEFTFEEPIYIGLGSHVNAFFKSLKNKTVVTLSITKPYILDVCLSCDDCSITYSASYIDKQNISPGQICEYDINRAFSVSSAMFNSMCKSFSKTATIAATKAEGQLSFSFELAGISSKTLTFGHKDVGQTSSYFCRFKSDSFVRIGKLSSFAAKPIKICAESDKPLLILTESTLGLVRVAMSPDENLE